MRAGVRQGKVEPLLRRGRDWRRTAIMRELLHETLPNMLNLSFTAEELTELRRLGDDFRQRYEARSSGERRRELTRFGIDLSWKIPPKN